jgi:hypothetical protein
MQMKRVAEFQADMALKLLPVARANDDADVFRACDRVSHGWLFGLRVMASDLHMVEAFLEATREG